MLSDSSKSYLIELGNLPEVLDALPQPIVFIKEDKIEYHNSAFTVMFGDDSVGLPFYKFATRDQQTRIRRKLQTLSYRNVNGETIFVKLVNYKSDVFSVELSVSSVRTPDDEKFLIISIQQIQSDEDIVQKFNEQALLLQKINDSIPDIVYVVDIKEKSNIFLKGSYMQLLGYDTTEVSEDDFRFLFTRIHPEDRLAFRESAEKIAGNLNDEYVETEYRIRKKGGDWIWLYNRSVPFKRSDDGEITQYLGTVQDVTRRKETEQELREKNAFIEKMTSVIPDYLYVFDKHSDYPIYNNYSVMRLLGYPDQKITIREFTERHVHPDDRERLYGHHIELFELERDEDLLEFEFRALGQNDRIVWLMARASIFMRNERGEAIQWFGMLQDITQRKKTQFALQENKNYLEKITNTIPDLIYVWQYDTYINIYSNFKGKTFLGYTEEEWGQLQDKHQFEEDQHKVLKDMETILHLEDSEFHMSEVRYWSKSEKLHWVQNRSRVFKRDPDGRPTEILSVVSDITRQKEAEETLDQSRTLYRTIAKHLPNGAAVMFDKELNFILAEGPLLKRQGYKQSDIEGTSAFDTLPDGKTWNGLRPYFERVLAGESIVLEVPDGRFLYFINMIPVKNEKGEIYAGLNITLDIREIKQAEEELKASEITRKAILETIPDSVFRIDASGKFVDHYSGSQVNRAPGDSLIGKYVSEVFDPENAIRFETSIHEVLKSSKGVTFEYESSNYSVPRYYEARINPVGNEVIAIVRDITEFRLVRGELDSRLNELSVKNDELEKYIASNLELERFAYIASHDLREPLRTIMGFTQLLQRRYAGNIDTEADEFMQHIVDGTKRMETLIHGLLQYSRVDSVTDSMEELDVGILLDKVLEDLAGSIEKNNVQITKGALPKVMGSELQIRQVFQNLIGNAIKFNQSKQVEITIESRQEGDHCALSVSDNGIGIKKEHGGKIFEIFQRVSSNSNYPGSGIGLAICKRIIERHNGDIWFESELNKGTTFYFTLPRAE